MKVKKLEKVTLLDQAYEELKSGLMKGEFLPGTVLSARSLANDMGTSVMPARDAIQKLVAERGLEMLPNRMARVPSTTLHEFNDLTKMRTRLEGLAARLAAERSTEMEITTIEEHNEAMRAAVDRNDVVEMLKSNNDFHFSLYRASKSEMLISLIESLWLRIGPLLLVSLQRLNSGELMFRDGSNLFHVEVINALKARDPEAAENAITNDITTAANWNIEHNSQLVRD